MLVGSIGWSKKVGESVKKGEDLGFFQYGGSTCIVVFPEGKVKMDEDLVKSSKEPLETLVKVGEHIGKAT
jgi:phosphatidylserine decarboxylase